MINFINGLVDVEVTADTEAPSVAPEVTTQEEGTTYEPITHTYTNYDATSTLPNDSTAPPYSQTYSSEIYPPFYFHDFSTV